MTAEKIHFTPETMPTMSEISLRLEKAKRKIEILLEENKKLRSQLAMKNFQESGISDFMTEKEVLCDLQINPEDLEKTIQKEQVIFIYFQGERLFLRQEIVNAKEKMMAAETIPLDRNTISQALAGLIPKDIS